jgi:hypothetical protein
MSSHHLIDPDRTRWVLLLVGLSALCGCALLMLAIQRLKRRYREGRQAIDDLRGQARGMQLQMEAPAEATSAPQPKGTNEK